MKKQTKHQFFKPAVRPGAAVSHIFKLNDPSISSPKEKNKAREIDSYITSLEREWVTDGLALMNFSFQVSRNSTNNNEVKLLCWCSLGRNYRLKQFQYRQKKKMKLFFREEN